MNFSYFYPTSWALPIAALGIVSFIFGFRKFGKGCLFLGVVLILVRPVRIFLLALFPAWIAFIIGLLALTVSVYAALRMIFGEEVMKGTTAQLLANVITGAARHTPRLVKPVGTALMPGGLISSLLVAFVKGAGGIFRQSSRNLIESGLAPPQLVDEKPATPSSEVTGKVIEVGEDASTIALLDGSLGRVFHEETKPLVLNQLITCRVIARLENGDTTLLKVDEGQG